MTIQAYAFFIMIIAIFVAKFSQNLTLRLHMNSRENYAQNILLDVIIANQLLELMKSSLAKPRVKDCAITVWLN